MSENETHIRFKLGEVEIECRGREEFLKKNVLSLAENFMELCKKHEEALSAFAPPPIENLSSAQTNTRDGGKKKDRSANQYAKLLGSESGTDLIIAATAYLRIEINQKNLQAKKF